MLCNKCFFFATTTKSCTERHNLPAEGDKCHFFTPQVNISLNKDEIWAVLDMYFYVRDKKEDMALNSFYDKIRMIINLPSHKTLNVSDNRQAGL